MKVEKIEYEKFPMDFIGSPITAFYKTRQNVDKFKMELTWHNCATCPPKEVYNPCLVITNGHHVDYFIYDKKYGFPITDDELHEYWWADITRTVRECSKFEEVRQ